MRLLRLPPLNWIRAERGSVSLELVLVLPLLFFGLVVTAVAFDGFRARNQTLVATHTVVDLLSRESSMFTTQQLERMNDVYDYLAQTRYPTRLRISSMIWNQAEGRHQLQWSYGTRGLMPLTDDMVRLLSTGLVTDWNSVLHLGAELPQDLANAPGTLPGTAGNLLEQITELPEATATGALSGVQQVAAGVSAHSTGPMAGMLGLPEVNLLARVPPAQPGEAVIVVESFARWTPFANVGIGQLRLSPIAAARPRFTPFVNLEGAIPVFPEDFTETPDEIEPVVADPNTPPPITATPNDVTPVTIFQTNFANGDTSGWSRNTTTSVAGLGRVLGLFGNETFAAPVTRALTLPAGTGRVDIAFDFWAVDSWDGRDPNYSDPIIGDVFSIFMNGRAISTDFFQIGTNAFHNRNRFTYVLHGPTAWTVTMQQTQNDVNIAGVSSWVDEIWRVTITGINPPSELVMGLSSRLSNAIANESWAITNVAVTATPGAGAAHGAPAPTGVQIGTHPGTRFPIYGGCPDPFLRGPVLSLRPADLSMEASAPAPNPGTAASLRGLNGQSFDFLVTGRASGAGAIWGTDIYSDDSPIATAAVHAGVLANGEAGIVRLTVAPGAASYTGSRRNAVTSQSWGSWWGSYTLARATAQNMDTRFSFLRQAGGQTAMTDCPGLPGEARFDGSALYVLDWNNEGLTGTGNRLRILTEDHNSGNSCDSALLVRDPDGQWWYNNDISGANRNARLDMGNAANGNYHIFLGTWSGNRCNTHLVMERY